MEELKELIRPNIRAMEGYSSAASELIGKVAIKLDANESPYGALNRYPSLVDYSALKSAISQWKGVEENRILLSNGSDESIDLIYRMVCVPSSDIALSFKPGFGMYKTAASLNDVEYLEIELNHNFDIDNQGLMSFLLKPELKLIFICSPNNPTGNSISRKSIEFILDNFNGLTVIDEAYIDFSTGKSCLELMKKYPRLIILQTMSKSASLAGARIGITFAHPYLVDILNKMKMPYNIGTPSLNAALLQIENQKAMAQWIQSIIEERESLGYELESLDFIEKVYPSDANFLFVKVTDGPGLFRYLNSKGISVRNKHTDFPNALRISIGTPQENSKLLSTLKDYTP